MKEIYNEGRVHGYSPYEIYVKHLLAEFPDTDIPTEKEWLASVISDGASIIMKIEAKTKAGVHDYVLPKNSKLCGASTLIATIFDGECNVDESGVWATAVTNYGPLASNTRQLHPETPGNNLTTYPIQPTIDYHNTSKIHKQYVKLIDGLMYQPGTWEYPEGQDTGYVDDQGQPIINYPNRHPFMNFKPDLSKNGVIRLRFSSNITNDFYILIHGFADKIALRPVFNQETGIIDNTDYEDGDYLGPLIFPWATKITFITSNEMLDMFEVPPYNRKIDRESTEKVVNAQPVIDMDSLNPISYYRDKHSDSAVPVDVTFANPSGDYVSALTVYQREDKDVNGLNARQ